MKILFSCLIRNKESVSKYIVFYNRQKTKNNHILGSRSHIISLFNVLSYLARVEIVTGQVPSSFFVILFIVATLVLVTLVGIALIIVTLGSSGLVIVALVGIVTLVVVTLLVTIILGSRLCFLSLSGSRLCFFSLSRSRSGSSSGGGSSGGSGSGSSGGSGSGSSGGSGGGSSGGSSDRSLGRSRCSGSLRAGSALGLFSSSFSSSSRGCLRLGLRNSSVLGTSSVVSISQSLRFSSLSIVSCSFGGSFLCITGSLCCFSIGSGLSFSFSGSLLFLLNGGFGGSGFLGSSFFSGLSLGLSGGGFGSSFLLEGLSVSFGFGSSLSFLCILSGKSFSGSILLCLSSSSGLLFSSLLSS